MIYYYLVVPLWVSTSTVVCLCSFRDPTKPKDAEWLYFGSNLSEIPINKAIGLLNRKAYVPWAGSPVMMHANKSTS